MQQNQAGEKGMQAWDQVPEDELRLSDYLHILRRRWAWAALVTGLAVAAAVALTLLRDPTYTADAEVLIRNTTNESLFPSGSEITERIQRESSAELQYTQSDAFIAAADRTTGFEADVEVEIKVLDADERIPGASGVLVFTASENSAEAAAAAANSYAEVYVSERNTEDVQAVDRLLSDAQSAVAEAIAQRGVLSAPLDALDAQIAATDDVAEKTDLLADRNLLESDIAAELAQIDVELNRALEQLAEVEDLADLVADAASAARVNVSAEVPGSPSSPGLARNIALALVVGLILGAGAAFLRHSLDNTVTDVDLTQRRLGLPFLGALPVLETRSNGGDRNVAIRRRDAEAFRSIRTSLRFAGEERRPLNVLGITSAAPGEGKTLCSIYLALALAIERGPVLLIDADLRRRAIHGRIGVENRTGLSDVLTGTATIDTAIQPVTGTSMEVITAGSMAPNPSELLGSTEFDQLIKELSTRYEAIVIDCPPLLAVADPRLIGTSVEGMLLVLVAGNTKASEADRATGLLREAGAHIAGFVLNRASGRSDSYYGYQYAEAYTDKD